MVSAHPKLYVSRALALTPYSELISMPLLNQGLTNLGALVGIVLALLVTGPLNDWVIVWMSLHNCGIYEPEYRLVFMPSMLFAVFGYVGWAVGNDHHMPWIGPIACIAYVHESLLNCASHRSRVPLPAYASIHENCAALIHHSYGLPSD